MNRVRARVAESATAFRAALANRAVRQVQVAVIGAELGGWAGSVALTVYAYDVAGPGGVALYLAVRMVPGAIVAPFAGYLADRFPAHG